MKTLIIIILILGAGITIIYYGAKAQIEFEEHMTFKECILYEIERDDSANRRCSGSKKETNIERTEYKCKLRTEDY